MQSKIIIAYEPRSSVTFRLTPSAIGELLSKMSPLQIEECFKSYTKESFCAKPKDWHIKKGIVFRELDSVKFTHKGNMVWRNET
jgi:hypothetical protein